jgi:hypothetical protein
VREASERERRDREAGGVPSHAQRALIGNRPEPIAEGYGLGAGVNQEPGAEMQIGKLSYVIWEVALGNMGKS